MHYLGHATQWGEVKKKNKDRARSKTPAATSGDGTTQSGRGSSRGGRGSYEGSRGTRGRGISERGTARGGSRGGLAGTRTRSTANGIAAKDAVVETANEWGDSNSNAGPPAWGATTAETEEEKPRDEADWEAGAGGIAWDAEPKPAGITLTPGWGDAEASISEAAKDVTPVAPMSASEKPASKSSIIPAGSKGSWASMFKVTSAPPPAPVVKKAPIAPKPEPAPATAVAPPPAPPVIEEPAPPTPKEEEIASLPPPPVAPISRSPIVTPALPEIIPPKIAEPENVSPPPSEQQAIIDRPPTPPDITNTSAVDALKVPPPDELTEDNLEKIEDLAPPRPSSTAAGTVNTPIPSSTPARGLPPLHRAPGSRSGMRRILDQQEAVVMPRDHSIDRTAVQFGSMGLNGDLDEPEETETPEQAETVAQPPQHSPIGQPKASLPASVIGSQPQAAVGGPSHSPFSSGQILHDALPAPRNAPGLAPPSHQNQMHLNPISQPPSAPQSMQTSQQHQSSSTFQSQSQSQSLPNQSKFTGPEHSKFEPFGQQLNQQQQQQQQQHQHSNHSQSPYGYPSHSQHQQPHQQSQQGSTTSSGMPSEYANYYGTEPGRTTYQGYYNQAPYGQHQQQPQEQGLNQPRSTSGLGQVGSGLESQPSSTGATSQQPLSRYTPAAQGVESGHASPSPALATAQQAQQHPQGYPVHPSYYPQYYNYMNV